VNILCQPHPDIGNTNSPHANRIILKFTAIDEPILNALGITPELVAELVPSFAVNKKQIAIDLARTIRDYVDALTPRPPVDAPPAIRALEAQIEQTLDAIALGFANTVYCAIDPLPASGAELASLIYGVIRDAAWAGLTCPDETLKLEGSVSYTGLSPFANVSGGVVISTTGSAGVVGAVNVFGIPVGQARVFVNQTDARGNPTLPAICGEVQAALGPLELGSLALLEDCPGCLDRLVASFANLGGALSSAYVYAVMSQVLPELADPALNATQHLARLDNLDRQMIFLAAVMHLPPRDAAGAIPEAFLDFVSQLADVMVPRYAMCGTVQPKLFGFPLSGGGKFYEYQFYAGPKLIGDQVQGLILRDQFGFSPVQMFSTYALAVTGVGSALSFLVPAIDEAQAATSFELASPGQIVRDGFTKPLPQFAAERTEDFLENALITFSYRLAPFGMELGRAGGRILFPSLEHHPRGPRPRTPPAQRNQGLPDRLEVLLAALGDKGQSNAVNRLADVTWKGEGDPDFQALFAGSPFENAVRRRSLSLRDDYFPHGGFLGAGLLDLPKLLSRPLPESLFTALDPSRSALDRLAALQDFVSNHLLASDRVGELAFYLPAPNPPLNQFPTTARELLDSLRGFIPADPFQVASYYPVEQGFFSGWLDTPILGLPTIRSQVTWQPSDQLFRLEGQVPPASWFNRLIGQATLVVDIRGNSNQVDAVSATFGVLSNQLARLNRNSPTLAAQVAAIANALPRQLAEGLPKIAMNLNASQVRIPVPTYDPRTPMLLPQVVATINQASVEAYSPYYQQPGATGDSPRDRARRDGGLAIRGDLRFMNGLVEVPGAEFALTPPPDALGLPVVSGSFAGRSVVLFGLPFGPATASRASAEPNPGRNLARTAAPRGPQIGFSSSSSAVRLTAEGSVPQVGLGSFFRIQPLSGDAINATATYETTTSALPTGHLTLSPSKLVSALFPSNTTVQIHGRTTADPFTVSADGPWNATVTLAGDEGVSLYAGGERVLRLTRPASARNAPFQASASGQGLTNLTLSLANLGLGVTVQSYPDAPFFDLRKRTFTLAAGAAVSLSIGGSGTFDLQATIPSPLSLVGLPFGELASGYQFRVTDRSVSFAGSTAGGLLEQLGGPSLQVSLAAAASGWSFSATAELPKLTFGVFELYQLSGAERVGPSVTLTQSGIALGHSVYVQVASAAAGSPSLALAPFTIASNGSFEATATHALTWEGRSMGNASIRLTRNAAGATALAASGSLAPITLTGFGSIEPVSGTQIQAGLTLDAAGNGSLRLDPAQLRLSTLGVTVDGTLHGTGGVAEPFTFSSQGPWSAASTFTSFAADPLAAGSFDAPELLRLSTPSGGGALFTAAVTGDQGNLVSLVGTRTGNVRLELLKGSAMERTFNNVNVGEAAFALTNNPRQLVVTLDPPDLSYSTNFVVATKPVTVALFQLASPSLKATLGSAGVERSLKLESPALTLLPGTFLEQTLTNLPTQELVSSANISEGTGAAFRIFTGAPVRKLSFAGLPVVRLPSGTANLLLLHPAGFSSPIPVQEGADYGGLVQFITTTAGLSLDFSGSWLRLRFGTGPALTALGRPVSAAGGEATLEVNVGGSFQGTFRTVNDPPKNLGFNLLSFQPSGTLTVAGIANSTSPDYRLAGSFSLHMAYPNPANPANTLTLRRDLAFDLKSGDSFSATVTGNLPAFNLGWLSVAPGEVAVSRNAATGAFSVSFNDWDLTVFGKSFADQDFTLSTTGVLTRNLSSSTFDLGLSGAGSLLRLITGGSVPFEWRVNPTGSAAGAIALDLPATTTLSFPNLLLLTGTLRDGLRFASALADIPANGTFDQTWSRSLTLNGLSFGSSAVRLRRESYHGPVLFTATRNDALGFAGLTLEVTADTANATSFAAKLTGTFAAFGYSFGQVALSLDFNDPTYPFKGTATISGVANQSFKIGPPGVAFVLNGASLGPFPLPGN
jgi:hypothetical protein